MTTPSHVSEQLLALYAGGFKGYIPDAEADRSFEVYLRDSGGYANAGDAIDDYSLAGTGAGKLSLPFIAATRLFPGCLPGGAQGRGSCVAWSTRNAALVSYCSYIVYGPNSERFSPPLVSQTAIDNGVYSTEGLYWFRSHGGDGWQCSAAAKVAVEKCGLLVRQAYPELGLDLTEYSAHTEGKWGMTQPPENVREVCRQHLVASATVAKGWEQVRDMLANGFALSTCGGESWSRDRDELGVSRRSPEGWAHAMAAIAADDRPEIRERYGCGLLLIANSWGAWNRGPDKIRGTEFRIPVGSFWARWDDCKDRYFVALGPSKGWPASKLPDWGLGGVI